MTVEVLLMIHLMTRTMTTSVHHLHTDAVIVDVLIQKVHVHVQTVDKSILQDDVPILLTD
jgi:hypothetical protein